LGLGWLGWQVMEQDRAVEAQRLQERLDSAADNVVAAFDAGLNASPVQVTITGAGAEVVPPGSLAFAPAAVSPMTVASDVFASAEAAEFSRDQRSSPAAAYLKLAESGDPRVRAEALVRAARVMRRERQWREALDVYRSLEQSGEILVAGMPASLVARAGRCSVLAESGAKALLAREAILLWEHLVGGRWDVTRGTLETYVDEIRRWTPEARFPQDWPERWAMAQAVEEMWRARRPGGGRRFLFPDGQPVSVAWSEHGGTWRAAVGGPSFWRSSWQGLEQKFGIRLAVKNEDGETVFGGEAPRGPAVFRASAISGLPVSVAVTAAEGRVQSDWRPARRRLMLAGLVVFAVLLTAGSFLIGKAISKELAVARLQSDFVSAVSHEFRTPLTSIRQLTELLARGRLEDQTQKQKAYELMMGESDRLKRLVESLLDFGRMQSGAYRFQFESVNAAEWARGVTEAFAEATRGRGVKLEFQCNSDHARIRADREVLSGALWNLLDNAVKYSVDDKRVRTAVEEVNGRVEVSVQDHGIGIDKRELKFVFDKFFRGESAKAAGTRGTGIGLAVVKEIVESHGGTVRVESEPGQGSAFTMVLPLEEGI